MVGMLDYRFHYPLLVVEQSLAQAERRQALNGVRIHVRPQRRGSRSRAGQGR